MEFSISNFQETLEKSRKVLMESLEFNLNSKNSKYSQLNTIKKHPEIFQISHSRQICDHQRYQCSVPIQDLEKKSEIERQSTCVSPNYFQEHTEPIDTAKLEAESKRIRIENEILTKKICKLQNESSRFDLAKHCLDPLLKRTEVHKPSENHKLRHKMKELEVNSKLQYEQINNKLTEILKEKAQMSSTAEQENKEIDKYKVLVTVLAKKLRNVEKKYTTLKSKEAVVKIRNQSAPKSVKVVNRIISTLKPTKKRNDRSLTPVRKS